MRLLITQRISVDRHGHLADMLESAYTRFFGAMGYALYPVSNFSDSVEQYFDLAGLGGVILSGGGDVSPEVGQYNSVSGLDSRQERDRVCMDVARTAIDKGLPVLGICYGMQLLNCMFGGNLRADIHAGCPCDRNPGQDHLIVFGNSKHLVNHYHIHGITTSGLAPVLEAFSRDADCDVVEGFTHKTLRVKGIQWHPERKSPEADLNARIIGALFHDGR